jgi:hypothetical protein
MLSFEENNITIYILDDPENVVLPYISSISSIYFVIYKIVTYFKYEYVVMMSMFEKKNKVIWTTTTYKNYKASAIHFFKLYAFNI